MDLTDIEVVAIVRRRRQVDEELRRSEPSSGGSRCPGLNRGPTVYETVALPLSYSGKVGGNWYPRQVDRESGPASEARGNGGRRRGGWRVANRPVGFWTWGRSRGRVGGGGAAGFDGGAEGGGELPVQ